jgi:hypothetical protein
LLSSTAGKYDVSRTLIAPEVGRALDVVVTEVRPMPLLKAG